MSAFDTLAADSEATTSGEALQSPTFDEIADLTDTQTQGDVLKPDYSTSDVEGIEEKSEKHIKNANSQTGDDETGRTEATDVEDTVQEIKMLKALMGEKEHEIPADALFTHTVDGEDVQISMQELLNHYSGQVAWDKRFQELGNEKKSFETERQQINALRAEYNKHLEGQDINSLMMLIGKEQGQDPYEFMKNIREQFLEQNTQLQTLTEEQRAAFLAEEKASYYQKQSETVQSQVQEQASQEALVSSIHEMQRTHGVEDAELESAWESLANHYGGQNGLIETFGSPEGAINALGQYIVNTRMYSRANSLIEPYADVMQGEQTSEVIEALVDAISNDNTLTDDEISGWLNELLGVQKSSKKISSRAKASGKLPAKEEKKSKMDNYFSFDDL